MAVPLAIRPDAESGPSVGANGGIETGPAGTEITAVAGADRIHPDAPRP